MAWFVAAALAVKPNELIMNVAISEQKHLTVSQAARLLHASPRDISDLFYRRQLRDDLCPIMAGRRMISPDYVELIRLALVRNGKKCVREAVNV